MSAPKKPQAPWQPSPFVTHSEPPPEYSPMTRCATPFLRANEAREAQGLPRLTWDDWLKLSPDSD